MKKLLLLFTLVTGLCSAQNRFIYEYKFVSDSTNKENVTKEMMYLDITKNGSQYYSREVFVRDSTMMAELEKQVKSGNFNINIRSGDRGKVNYKILKNYEANKVFFNTRIGQDNYKVLEDRTIEWKVWPDKKKIGEFEAQKATAIFGGRKWTAWFSEELPFNDGPYKFRGLPGLIVKVEDDTQSHVMELKGSTKFTPNDKKEGAFGSDGGRVVIMGSFSSNSKEAVEINRQQFKKLFWEDREDPMKSLKMMQGREGVVMKFKDQSGNDISMADMIKNREEAAKEAAKRNNNLIELDLLKK